MADYDTIAKEYSESMGEQGDFYHKTQIDPFIYEIIGNPKGKVIYDIGCGNGYIARNLAKKGARVFASDISSELIKIAKDKSKNLDITYSIQDATDFTGFRDEQFDVVVMNMVVHYIEDLDKLFKDISRVLKKSGILALSTSHPFRPGRPYADWEKGKLNNKEVLFIKVTGYLLRGGRVGTCWCGDKTKLKLFNHPISDLVNVMAKYGLYILRMYEPESQGFAGSFPEKLRDTAHIPTYIIFGAVKSNNAKIYP